VPRENSGEAFPGDTRARTLSLPGRVVLDKRTAAAARPRARALLLLAAAALGGLRPHALGAGVGMSGMPVPAPGEHFVVVGGGVCGVTCCQTLAAALQESGGGGRGTPGAAPGAGGRVTLIAAAGLLKGVANVVRLTRHLDAFDVVERAFDDISGPHTEVVEGEAVAVDTGAKVLSLRDGRTVSFDKLCICTGATPKSVSDNPRVLTLRDTASALQLRDKLQSCRRVLITGNGGIALELVHEIVDCEVVWVVREGHIGNAFFDEDAAQFLAPALAERLVPAPADSQAPLPASFSEDQDRASERPSGAGAGGPNQPKGTCDEAASSAGGRVGAVRGSSLGPQWIHASLGLEYKAAQVKCSL